VVNTEIAREVSVELKKSVLSATKTINIDIENVDNLEGGNMTMNNIIINKEGYISNNVSNVSNASICK
jgi:Cu/Ag efflux protein CusF